MAKDENNEAGSIFSEPGHWLHYACACGQNPLKPSRRHFCTGMQCGSQPFHVKISETLYNVL